MKGISRYFVLIINAVIALNAMEENNKIVEENNNEIVGENNNKNISEKVNVDRKCSCFDVFKKTFGQQPEKKIQLLEKLEIRAERVKNNRNAIKLIFALCDAQDNSELVNLNPNCFSIRVYDENNKEIDNVLTGWMGKKVNNGDTLLSIKRGFWDPTKSSPYSISFKVNDNVYNKVRIGIFYELGDDGKKEIKVLYKDSELQNIYDLICDEGEDVLKIIEDIKDKCYCQSVKGNLDAIKICFPKVDGLINKNLGEYFSINIEDKDGNAIDDVVLSAWDVNKKVKNGTKLSFIKKGFLTVFKNSKFENVDPYSISMHVINHTYDEFKIRINYGKDNYFYIKNDTSEIINIKKLTGSNLTNVVIPCKNIDKEDEIVYKKEVKEMFDKGIECSSVSNIANTIKIKFAQNNKLLNKENSKLFKIFILDEDDNILCSDVNKDSEGVALMTWVNYTPIKSGELISNIKKLFLTETQRFPTNKPFEVSLRYKSSIYTKIKIKIVYDDLFEFVKLNGSEIIEFDKL